LISNENEIRSADFLHPILPTTQYADEDDQNENCSVDRRLPALGIDKTDTVKADTLNSLDGYEGSYF